MSEHVLALVLRRRDTGESDRRLTLLTRELGKLEAIAKGAKKPGSRLAGVSDPLCISELQLSAGKRNRFVSQAQPMQSFRGIRDDYDRLACALAFCECVAALAPFEQPDPDLFDLSVATVAALDGHPKPHVVLAWGLARLLADSGFHSGWSECVVTGEPVQEAEPYLSPVAGGYVSFDSCGRFSDRFQSKAEVLYGLAKLVERDRPPPNLKLCDSTLATLLPFLRAAAESPLPATESVVQELLHAPVPSSE
jgi:DNA repair protein RecO (recombination protein O)